jgi:hypothetical protein
MRQFTMQVAVVFAASVLCAAYPMARYASDDVLVRATGALLSTANADGFSPSS